MIASNSILGLWMSVFVPDAVLAITYPRNAMGVAIYVGIAE
jgi:hypothetical protein